MAYYLQASLDMIYSNHMIHLGFSSFILSWDTLEIPPP